MSAAADLSDLGLSEDVQKLDTQALLELYKKTGDEAVKWAIVLRCEGLIRFRAFTAASLRWMTS